MKRIIRWFRQLACSHTSWTTFAMKQQVGEEELYWNEGRCDACGKKYISVFRVYDIYTGALKEVRKP